MGVSVVIAARNEFWLNRTLADIYQKFEGNFEVVVVLDGPTQYPVNHIYPNLYVYENASPVGIRPSINEAIRRSQYDYILKTDAHCMFCEEFDTLLTGACDKESVMVARRYTLDTAGFWEKRPRAVDYYYLSCPWTHPHSMMMQSCPWITRTEQRESARTDELMCFQGSMWFMHKDHWNWLGGLTENLSYAEHHEISMKTWLGGRRVLINKNAWYAHPRKNVTGYRMELDEVYHDHEISARYWMSQPGFTDLINRFWPLPTENNRHRIEKYYWPENWRMQYDVIRNSVQV